MRQVFAPLGTLAHLGLKGSCWQLRAMVWRPTYLIQRCIAPVRKSNACLGVAAEDHGVGLGVDAAFDGVGAEAAVGEGVERGSGVFEAGGFVPFGCCGSGDVAVSGGELRDRVEQQVVLPFGRELIESRPQFAHLRYRQPDRLLLRQVELVELCPADHSRVPSASVAR